MKTKLLALLLLLTIPSQSETVTLIAQPVSGGGDSSTLTLATGDTATLTYASFIPSGLFTPSVVRIVAATNKATFEMPTAIVASETTSGTAYALNKINLTGPATIKLRVGWVTTTPDAHGVYKKPELATIDVKRYGMPSDGIPLPQGTTLWTVLLETSTDLETWLPISPGDYASTSPTRFFRTRVLAK